MPSNNNQLSYLKEISDLDKVLWQAFKQAEKEEPIPFHKGTFLSSKYKEMKQKGFAKGLASNYLVPFLLTIVFAIVFISSSAAKQNERSVGYIALALYCICLLWTFWSRAVFVKNYSQFELRGSNFTDYAFGLNSASLLVKRVIDARKIPASARKETFDALIKINKAAQEHGDANYGFVEILKKTAYTGLFSIVPAVGWINAHQNEIQSASDNVLTKASNSWILYVSVLIFLICVVALAYDIIIGQPRLKKKKKRYLLVLNIIKETIQK